MKISYAAFTDPGMMLAARLAGHFGGSLTRIGQEAGLDEWTAREFGDADALVFVGAAGIAVRAVAPLISSKAKDPAVVVTDETGRFVIPLLGGHLGGANELAGKIASFLQGQCVLTTATDVRGVFAVDDWARKEGLLVLNTAGIKMFSGALLQGGRLFWFSDFPVRGKAPEGLSRGSFRTGDLLITCRRPDREDALVLVPRALVIGIGCRRGTDGETIRAAVESFLEQSGYLPEGVAGICSIDLKKEEAGIRSFADEWKVPFITYTASELEAAEGDFTASEFVREVTGTDNVCERSVVCAGAGLLVKKTVCGPVTLALGILPADLSWPDMSDRSGRGLLSIVGIGPGKESALTREAAEALREADLICGYGKYVDQVKRLFPGKETYTTPMTKELERCRYAVKEAERGRSVAMVCSGDAGIYGMAGPLLEMAAGTDAFDTVICPGITAAVSGAALLGAPLMNDFCVISLSDRLTPWEVIEHRLRAAAEGGFVICLYNPASRARAGHLARAAGVLLETLSGRTACGLVRCIGREGQSVRRTVLSELANEQADMFTTVFIGNAGTHFSGGYMITPRGYEKGNENSFVWRDQ